MAEEQESKTNEEQEAEKKAIERLKAEKAEIINEAINDGKKDGYKVAKDMAYIELRQVTKILEEIGFEQDYPDAVRELELYNEWLGPDWIIEGGFSDVEDEYLIGWTKGVVKFYNEIQSKL